MLPVWQHAVQPHVEAGRVTVIGVAQEQHPERATLYRQWRQLGWPIAVDPLNELGLAAVPIVVGIDESGVVRARNLKPDQLVEQFLEPTWPRVDAPRPLTVAGHRDVMRRQHAVQQDNTAAAWQALGDSLFHAGRLDEAIDAFRHAVTRDAGLATAWFRLGVSHHRRFEGSADHGADGQAAIDAWAQALALDPNQYIWRRRLQQFGPRLDKPYDFYSWVESARTEIRGRGETPAPLQQAPAGAEIIAPGVAPAALDMTDVDPHDRVHRDDGPFVRVAGVVVPARVRPGRRVRVRWHCDLIAPDNLGKWSNEGAPMRVVVRPPSGVTVVEGTTVWTAPPRQPTTTERRQLDVELALDAALPDGRLTVPAYVLYGVCESETGRCRWLRQDVGVDLTVDTNAVPLGQ